MSLFNQFVVICILYACCVFIGESSVMQGFSENKDDLTKCYIPERNGDWLIVEFGETRPFKTICCEAFCYGVSKVPKPRVAYEQRCCGVIAIEGCEELVVDKTLPFPNCCPQGKCKKWKEGQKPEGF